MVEMFVPAFHRIMLPSSSGYSNTSHDGGNVSLLYVNFYQTTWHHIQEECTGYRQNNGNNCERHFFINMELGHHLPVI